MCCNGTLVLPIVLWCYQLATPLVFVLLFMKMCSLTELLLNFWCALELPGWAFCWFYCFNFVFSSWPFLFFSTFFPKRTFAEQVNKEINLSLRCVLVFCSSQVWIVVTTAPVDTSFCMDMMYLGYHYHSNHHSCGICRSVFICGSIFGHVLHVISDDKNQGYGLTST